MTNTNTKTNDAAKQNDGINERIKQALDGSFWMDGGKLNTSYMTECISLTLWNNEKLNNDALETERSVHNIVRDAISICFTEIYKNEFHPEVGKVNADQGLAYIKSLWDRKLKLHEVYYL